jgi:hypothetical protein
MGRHRPLPESSPRLASPIAIALGGLGALAVAIGIGRFAFTPLFPLMQQETGLSINDGAWLASANYVGYLLGAVAAMVVPVPVAWGVRGGLIVIGVVTLGMGLEDRLEGWLLLRWLAGMASAWVLIGVSAHCLALLTPLRRPLLSSVVFAGVGTGIAAAGLLCVILMRLDAAASSGWVGFGVAALAVAGATWRVFGEGAAARAPGTGEDLPPVTGWPGSSTRLILCYGAFGFGYIIPATFLPVQAREAIGDPSVFGWAWPLFGLAAAGSTLGAALVSRLVDSRRLWVGAQLVMATGVILPVLWPGAVAIGLAGMLVGGTFMLITLAWMQEAQRVAGPRSGRLMSSMTAAFAAGQIAGPLSVRVLVGPAGGFEPALLIASVLLAATACALTDRLPARVPAPARRPCA